MMRHIMLLGTVAGRMLAADGVPFIGSRYARRVLVLSATLTAAMVVGLLAFATSARADVDCQDIFCLEKTATRDPATVGEPLTFTITGYCTPDISCGRRSISGLTDTLPAGLEFVSATATGYGGTELSPIPQPTCSESAGTVTCTPVAFFFDTRDGTAVPFEATIEVIPRQCGTFTNTASLPGFDQSVSETFTVEGCVPTPPATKAQCKKGGWSNFGYPDQGTCISVVNQNRP
jgi:hypothetical protein